MDKIVAERNAEVYLTISMKDKLMKFVFINLGWITENKKNLSLYIVATLTFFSVTFSAAAATCSDLEASLTVIGNKVYATQHAEVLYCLSLYPSGYVCGSDIQFWIENQVSNGAEQRRIKYRYVGPASTGSVLSVWYTAWENCGCTVDKVAEITDPVAKQYEDGTYSDDKPDIDHLTQSTQTGLACIQQKVAALNCYKTPKPTSGYRPTAYQKHLLDVYDQWQKIKDNNDPACADTKASIEKEFNKHSPFAREPGITSRHSQLDAQGNPAGNAVDISFVPDDANVSADAVACQCNMYRPLINMPDPTKNDPIHYQPRTCLP